MRQSRPERSPTPLSWPALLLGLAALLTMACSEAKAGTPECCRKGMKSATDVCCEQDGVPAS